MADPTPDEVRAALAILAAAETAREAEQVSAAAPEQVSAAAPEQVSAVEHSEPAAPTATPREPAVDVAPVLDPYLARSVKSSPNGF